MVGAMSCDLALAYDPVTMRCDLVYDGHDFVLDSTPATPMLMALLSRRRAHPDDVVPDVSPASPLAPSQLGARGGWPGDALDPLARLTGSRLWLLRRAKAIEATRRLAEDAAAEGLEQVETDNNLSIALTVGWAAQALAGGKILQITAAAGATSASVVQVLGG